MNFKKTKLYNGYFAIIDFGYYQKKIVLNNNIQLKKNYIFFYLLNNKFINNINFY